MITVMINRVAGVHYTHTVSNQVHYMCNLITLLCHKVELHVPTCVLHV